MDAIRFNNLQLAIYDAVKNYFLFYFPDYTTQYYFSQEITKLYELLLNKKSHPITIRWNRFIKDIKNKYPAYKAYNLHSNYPSWTMKITIPPPDEEVVDLNAYISISLISPFYVFFIEEKKTDSIRLYVSPYGIYEGLFKQFEKFIEESFHEYVFIGWHILTKSFFNLVSPGVNTASREDGRPDKNVSILKGLFFDFEVDQEGFFDQAGDLTYKSENNIIEMDRQKLQSMKQLLNDKSVDYQEIF